MDTILSAKETSLNLIKKLKDDITYEEIMYELYFLQKIENGMKDVENGRTVSHEEVKKELSTCWMTVKKMQKF